MNIPQSISFLFIIRIISAVVNDDRIILGSFPSAVASLTLRLHPVSGPFLILDNAETFPTVIIPFTVVLGLISVWESGL